VRLAVGTSDQPRGLQAFPKIASTRAARLCLGCRGDNVELMLHDRRHLRGLGLNDAGRAGDGDANAEPLDQRSLVGRIEDTIFNRVFCRSGYQDKDMRGCRQKAED
jgi:hypothetical protein